MRRLIYAPPDRAYSLYLTPVTIRGLLDAQAIPRDDLALTSEWMASHVRALSPSGPLAGIFDQPLHIQDAARLTPDEAREVILALPLDEWRGVLKLLQSTMTPRREDADPLGDGPPQS